MYSKQKFGSAPGAKGATSSTGVAEPPPGMKSVTPKKSPYTKNRRQIVTPDEINALFVSKSSYDTEESNEKSNKINASNKENTNDDNEENDNDEGNFMQNIKNSFSSAMSQVELRSNANAKSEENKNAVHNGIIELYLQVKIRSNDEVKYILICL